MGRRQERLQVKCANCKKIKLIIQSEWDESESKVFVCNKLCLAEWMKGKKKKLTHAPNREHER